MWLAPELEDMFKRRDESGILAYLQQFGHVEFSAFSAAILNDCPRVLEYLVNYVNSGASSAEEQQNRIRYYLRGSSVVNTLIETAVANGHYNFMSFLIESFPSREQFRSISMGSAIYGGNLKCIDYVLKHCYYRIPTSPEQIVDKIREQNHKNAKKMLAYFKPLVLECERLYEHFMAGDYPSVIDLIHKNPRLAFDSVWDGQNLATLAVLHGKVEMLTILNEHIRSYYCDTEICDHVLREAFETYGYKSTERYQNALSYAILGNHLDCLQVLVEDCCPDKFGVFEIEFRSSSQEASSYEILLHTAIRNENRSMKIIDYILLNCRKLNIILKRKICSSSRRAGTPFYRNYQNDIRDFCQRRGWTEIAERLQDRTKLNWDREYNLVARSLNAIYKTGSSLPELMLNVVCQEIELRSCT